MRVLLASHFPLTMSPAGLWVQRLAAGLMAAGHEVRGLIADSEGQEPGPFSVRRVVCRKGDATADLPFDVPYFSDEGPGGQTFATLTTDQLAAYRQVLRRQLDGEVHTFDPHVIHVQHVWVLGQLALETGVPYALTAWGPELAATALDARYRPLAEQAAENASRILTTSDDLRKQVASTFEHAGEHTVVAPLDVPAHVAIYEALLRDRFG